MNDKLYRDLRAKIKERRDFKKKHGLPFSNKDIKEEIDNVLAEREAQRVVEAVNKRDGDRDKIS